MKARNEVRFLFILHDSLKLQVKSGHPLGSAYQTSSRLWNDSLSRNLCPVCLQNILKRYVRYRTLAPCIQPTLIMITKVDWNNEGFAAGSKTVVLDWKDWNNPLISRLRTKLLRNNTCRRVTWSLAHSNQEQPTKFVIAVLNRTSNVSSCADRSMLCTPEETARQQN